MRFIEWQAKECKEPMMDVSPVINVLNTLNLLTGCLQHFVQIQKTLSEQEYERLVVFSLAWAIGGIYEAQDRIRMHELFLSKNAPVPQKSKENETIFDYFVS